MAAASLTVAALRHRPRQALLVVVLAAVVGASAVLGPLYARAVEQSVLRTVLSDAAAPARGVVMTASGNKPASPDAIAAVVRAADAPQLGTPIGGADTRVVLAGAAGSTAEPRGATRLTSRDGLCRHLTMAAGTCLDQAAGHTVLVSRRNATTLGLAVGDHVRLADSTGTAAALPATVAGIYQPFDAAGDYWFDRSALGVAPPGGRQGATLPVLDTVFTTWSTLRSQPWSEIRTHVDVPLRVARVDLDSLASARAAAGRLDVRGRSVGAAATTGLSALVASTDSQREQTRTVVPLLAVQLALLGLVVLGFVCAAATEARRPEVALARLRGMRSAGTAGLLVRELGLLVVVGSVLGAAVGWWVTAVAAGRWLAPGVQLEPRWPVGVAVLAATTAGLLAVAVTAAPTLRQPLVSLLRRVPPRASALRVGLVEGGLVAATAAGVVTLLSGGADARGSRGPVALLAPGLLAVAGGLLLAQAVVPISGPLARRALRRGRLVSALAGTQVARRPALRRLIAIITVACALLVFAVDTWAVADRNRTTRAGLEAGAPVVLSVDARDAKTLRDAVLAIDPRADFATPVVTAVSATEDGPKTTAVEPLAFARIARWGAETSRPRRTTLATLVTPRVPALRLTGDLVQLDATASFTGVSQGPGQRRPTPKPIHLLLHLTSADDNRLVDVDLGPLRRGTSSYRAELPCTHGCLLREVELRRTFGDFTDADIALTVHRLQTGPRGALASVDLGPADNEATWQSASDRFGLGGAAVDPRRPLSFVGTSYGTSLSVARGDVPVQPPALVAGRLPTLQSGPNPSQRAAAPDLTGFEAVYRQTGRLTQVPRNGARGVLTNLDLIADAAGPPTAQTSYAVWLAADDAVRERTLRARLADRGIVVTARDSIRDHERALASEGPTLALRLALLAGVVSLVLAAAVLVVGIATSGASRARDLAGLRLVGVPARVVRAAAIREHVTVAVLGVVAGVGLGLAAAQAALPQVPMFAHSGPRLVLVRDPAWPQVGVAAASCLVLLVLVSVLVGLSLARSAMPARLREGQ
ncbi:MAG: FtsX-like permease family protein [Actinomycetes bacterium]